MAIETTAQRLSAYPFPSITICNQNKVSKAKLQRILRQQPKYQTFSSEQMALAMSALLLKADRDPEVTRLLNTFSTMLNQSGISLTDLLNATIEVRR